MRFRIEKLMESLEGFKPVLEGHWAEVSDMSIPLDVDWDMYAALEKAGCLHFVTIRESGKLIGYALFMVVPNIHSRGRIVADADAFYVDPEYRGNGLGKSLIKFSVQSLKRKHRPASILIGTRAIFDVTKLLEDQGFRLIEHKFILET